MKSGRAKATSADRAISFVAKVLILQIVATGRYLRLFDAKDLTEQGQSTAVRLYRVDRSRPV
jgi:hypothetical protein